MIKNLLKAGVIEEVKHCTIYWLRGTFIKKPEKKGLCLVTGFRSVIKLIRRPA